MDVYQRLQERLDLHAAGAPASESFTEILKIMFTTGEAEIACQLTFAPQPLGKLAAKLEMDGAELQVILEKMADRGSIIGIKTKEQSVYCLIPTVPGLFEYPFMRVEREPEAERLAHLWHEYHRDGFTDAFAGSPTPQMRVISVQKSIPMVSEVVTYDQVSEMIDRAQKHAVTNCACRVSMGKTCGKSIEVCLVFDNIARTLVERDRARWISKDEAMDILNRVEEEGMVHCISNSADKPALICNCCRCCCTILRGITEIGNPNIIATSAFVVSLDEDLCTGCLLCTQDRCPMAIIEEKDDIVVIDSSRCIGCGLCATVCPTEALAMRRREVVPPVPATGKDLMTAILKEKGKLEGFMKMNRG